MTQQALTLKQSGVRWLWLALLVFVADIAIKLVVMNSMGYGWENRIEILPFFNLLYVHNYGAAFSFLSDQAGWQRWLFTGIAFAVVGLLASGCVAYRPATNGITWLMHSLSVVL